jgi:hypothetical protein
MKAIRGRGIRDGLSIAGVTWTVALFVIAPGAIGYDAWAYYTVDPLAPYVFAASPDQHGAFWYSPAAAQAFALTNWLPWPAFYALHTSISLVALAWLGRDWALATLVYVGFGADLCQGNIGILLGAAIYAGFRWPAVWAIVLLTKVTPGVGLLWFAVRREWRHLAIALGVTAAIAGISFVIAPSAWIEWPLAVFAVRAGAEPLFPVRLCGAVALVVFGAATSRPWTVAVAAVLAVGALDLKSSAIIVALVPMLRARLEVRRAAAAPSIAAA